MPEDSDSSVLSAFQTVTRGAGAKFAGMGTTRILAFVTTFLLTRSLGANLYGVYSFSKNIISIGAVFANLGTDQALTRFVPEYEDDNSSQSRVLGIASLTSLVASMVAGLALFFAAPLVTGLTLDQAVLTDVLRVFAIALPFSTLNGCVSNAFRGLQLPGYQELTTNVLRQIFRLLTVVVAVAIGASLIGFIWAMVVAWALAFFIGAVLLFSRTDIRPKINKGSQPDLYRFYNYSIPLTIGGIGTLLQNRVDILMVGIFLSGNAVGIYNLSIVLSQTLKLPLTGFSTMYPPIAARMYGNDKMADLDALFTRVTRWSFTLSLLPSLGLLLFSEEILSIFGSGFAAGTEVLSLFVIANLTSAAVGPSSYTLSMTDHQYLVMVNQWALGIFNIVFNYLFITRFGLIGAALATAGTLAFLNIINVIEVWYCEGLFPYSRKYIKPLTAGLASGLVMEGWRVLSPLSGLLLVFAAGVSGTIVFGLVILAIGIEQEDKEFFEAVLP